MADRGIQHGTRYAYCHHECRCDDCRAVNNEYMAAYKQRPEVRVVTRSYDRDRKMYLRRFGKIQPGWRDQIRQFRKEQGET